MLKLEDLARKKRLPVKWLQEIGVEQRGDSVAIHYKKRDLTEARLRLRTGLTSKDSFRWEGSGQIAVYGLWRLRIEPVILVEGESDCWTLWHKGYNALGIPGATSTKHITLEDIVNINKVYIWKENDNGGESFVQCIAKRLHEIGWAGKSLILGISGFKDPSEMYLNNEKDFKKIMQYISMRAKPVVYSAPAPKIQRIMPKIEGDLVKKAKSIPLDQVVGIEKGFMLCPFHEDKKPSAWVKNGYGYCFVCSKSFDSIAYVRKTKGVSFMDAVKYLCGRVE